MKRLLSALTLSLLIAGCGGGGGSDYSTDLTTSGSTTTVEETTQKTVVATVEASLVKGATVCVKDTSVCAETDDSGKARLTVNALPVSLEVRVGSLKLAELTVSTDVARLNPVLLAKGDLPAALALAGVLHGAAGDEEGTAEKIDLSGVEILPEEEVSGNLVDALKEKKELKLKVKKGTEVSEIEVKVSEDSVEVKVDGKEVNPVGDEVKLLLWKASTFLTAADGKTVKLKTPEGEVVSCSLEVNPADPNQFKLNNCSDSEFNDDNYETIAVENGRVIVKDEDGEKFFVEDINITSFTATLENEKGEKELVWLADVPGIVPELTTEEAREKLAQGKFDLVYSYLTAKDDLNDEEKILLALAVLGKAAKDNLLVPAGLVVVTTGEGFNVVESDSSDVSFQVLQDGAESFLTGIGRAIEELEKVENPQSIEVSISALGPDKVKLDPISLKLVEAQLYYARSNLEYILGYDWSVFDNLEDETPALKAAEMLRFKDENRFAQARDDLKKSLELMAQAGSELDVNGDTSLLIYNLIEPYSDGSVVGFRIGDEVWAEDNVRLVLEDFQDLTDDLKADVKVPVSPYDSSSEVKSYSVDVAHIFEEPVSGDDIKTDVDSGNLLEVSACMEGYYDENGNLYCFEEDEILLFTESSVLYKKLKSTYPELPLKEVTYNGKTYYTYTDYLEIYGVVYPEKS